MRKLLLLFFFLGAYVLNAQQYCFVNCREAFPGVQTDSLLFIEMSGRQFDPINSCPGTSEQTTDTLFTTATGAVMSTQNATYTDAAVVGWVDWDNSISFEPTEMIQFAGHISVGQTAAVVPPPGTATGTYRMRVKLMNAVDVALAQGDACYGSGTVYHSVDFSISVVDVIPENPNEPDYCDASGDPFCASTSTNTNDPTVTDSAFTFIDEVKIQDDNGEVVNQTACDVYGDYTDIVATWTAGNPYTVVVSTGTRDNAVNNNAAQVGAVYIDWNQDFAFDETETSLLSLPPQGDSVFAAIIANPTVSTGLYRMRIRTTALLGTPEPCGAQPIGEVEDYTIFIQDPAAPVPECAALVAPADMADNLCTNLEFTWTTAAEADSYNLVISQLGSENEFRFDGLTDTTQIVSNLPANSDFEWEVEAVNENGQSFGCEVFTFSTGNANPTAAFDAESVSVCPNESFTFSAVVSGGDTPYDYTWSGDGAAFLDDVSAEMPNLVNPTPGVYTLSVSVTDARGCQSNTATQELVIKSVLQAEDIELLNPVACSNEDIKFLYNANFNAVFQESDDNVTFTDFPPNYLSGDTVLYNQPNAGEKFIRAIVTSNGCSDTSAVVTQERLAPLAEAEIDFFAGEAVNCPEDEVAMQAANYDNGITWSNGATTDTITIAETGSYSYTYTDANGCSTTSEAIDVTIVELDAPLQLNESADTVALCEGNEFILTVNNADAVWNDANSTANDTLVVSTEGLYKATVTKDGCAFVSDSVFVKVNPTPEAIVLDFDSEQSLCAGTDSLVITGVEGMEWTVPAGVTTASITVFESGSYFGSITNEFGCTALSDTADVVFNEAPAQPEITREDSILYVAGAEGNARIWILDGTNISINDTIVLDEPGEYQVVLVSPEGCFSDTSDVFLFDPIGIQESLADAGIQVYPVPTTDNTVYLKTEQNVSFRLIAADGRMLQEGSVASGTTGQIAVPTQGYYFLQVSTDGASWTVKLLSN